MKKLKIIKSFQVDHRKLQAGFYVSRHDHVLSNNCHACVTTFDLRFFAPSEHCYLTQSGLHTIEHLGATFLRNHPRLGNKIIYFGPMGCLTGFYLVVAGWQSAGASSEFFIAVKDMFRYIINYEGDIPGATEIECGNFVMHDLCLAKLHAKDYLSALENNPCFEYPILPSPLAST